MGKRNVEENAAGHFERKHPGWVPFTTARPCELRLKRFNRLFFVH
jgi:hypothetical protein